MRRSGDQASRDIRRCVARVPAALAGLVVVVVLCGLAWALLVPPWQSPDEIAHFDYAESLAARQVLPGTAGRGQGSTDRSRADAAVGASQGAFFPQSSPPSWSPETFRSYVAAAKGYSHSDGGGPNPNSVNPPLYYLFADIAFQADSGGNAFGQLYAMRIWGVLLLALTAVGGWLLAGEALGRWRLVQLVCGAVVALLPMTTFMSTNVNPDALMITLWTWALWLGVRVVKHGARRADAVALCGVTAAAVLTKATSYALVIPVLMALAVGWRSLPAEPRRARRRDVVTALAALVGPVVAWLLITVALHRSAVNPIKPLAGAHPFSVTQLMSYVWQFYLPRLPFMSPMRDSAGLPLYDIWIKQGWATFGWLDVSLPQFAYKMLAVITALIIVLAMALLGRLLVINPRRWAVPAFLVLTALALLAFLHLADYRSVIAGRGVLLQGRYLLPIAGLFGLAVAALVGRLSVSRQAVTAGVVLIGLVALQVLSLSTIAHVYYA